ncbi:MAG: two-component regulator propeller domain-containing protein [Ardenticatenales bacterium]
MTISLPPRSMARPRRAAPQLGRVRLAVCAALIALLSARAVAPHPAAAQIAPAPVAPSANHPGDASAWRTFASGDEVLALQSDPRVSTRLWAGTESGGVVVWDAAAGTFTQFVAPAQPGLRANRVYDIAFDPSSATPWLATAGGVVRADGPIWRSWGRADGLPSDAVRTVTIDGRGTVWAGSDAGIAYLSAGAERFVVVPRDTFTKFSRAAKKGPGATGAADSLLDSRGRVWFAHGRDRVDEDRAALSYFDPADGAWRHITSVGPSGNPHNGPQTEQITALAADPRDGSVWAGTWLRGLYHFDGNEWQWHTPQSGLCGKSITALAAVGTQLWAACGDDRGAVGTSMWDGARWSTAPAAPGTPYYTGIGRAAGRVWFAADGDASTGLTTRDGGAPRTLTTAGELPAANDITALAVDGRGGLWAGTRGYGLLGYDGSRWRVVTRASSAGRLVGDAITDLAIDGDTLWVASTKSIYDGSAWVDGGVSALDVRTGQWLEAIRQSAAGLPDNDVGSLLAAADGRLWIGLGASPDGPGASGTTSRGNGIAIYDPRTKSWEDHTYRSTDRALVGDTILDLAAGPNGIWAAASHHLDPDTESRVGGGVSRAANEQFGGWTGGQDGLDTYHGSGFGRDPLVTGDVRSIVVAPGGDVWAGTYDIDSQRATIASIWPFLDAVVNRWDGRLWHATRFDGDGWVEALALDESGRLWAGTTRGHGTSEHAVVGFDSVDKAAGGLRIFDGRTWYTLAPAPDTLGIKAVTALAWDAARGGMWVGTENAGVHFFRARPPTPTPMPTSTPIATSTIEPTPTAPASATPTATVPLATPTLAGARRLFLPFALLRADGATATRH